MQAEIVEEGGKTAKQTKRKDGVTNRFSALFPRSFGMRLSLDRSDELHICPWRYLGESGCSAGKPRILDKEGTKQGRSRCSRIGDGSIWHCQKGVDEGPGRISCRGRSPRRARLARRGGWSWDGGWKRMPTSATIVPGGRRIASSGSLATAGPRQKDPRRGKGRKSLL